MSARLPPFLPPPPRQVQPRVLRVLPRHTSRRPTPSPAAMRTPIQSQPSPTPWLSNLGTSPMRAGDGMPIVLSCPCTAIYDPLRLLAPSAGIAICSSPFREMAHFSSTLSALTSIIRKLLPSIYTPMLYIPLYMQYPHARPYCH